MSSSSSRWNRGFASRLVLLLFALLALGVVPRAQRTVKLATLVPDGSLWGKAIRRMGAEWKKRTDGRVTLRVFAGGMAGDESVLIRKMRVGGLHAAALTTSGLGTLDPAFLVFEVPLLFRNDAEVRYVLERMGPLFEKRLEKKDFVLVHWGHAGWLRFFSKEPIRSYEDFLGMKQFVWGESEFTDLYTAEGMRTVPLAFTDVMIGLQTGLIDAFPVPPLVALSYQYFRSAPYMFDHRIAPLVGATIFTKRAWSRIRSEDQASILSVARQTGESFFAEVPPQEAQALQAMKERGLTITRWAEGEDERKWMAMADRFREGLLRDSTIPPEVLREVVRHLEEFRRAAWLAGATLGGVLLARVH